jgi:toxin ParE1/3/4
MPRALIVRFHAQARAEFDSAVEYYNNAEPGLGEDFVAAVGHALRRTLSNPELWPPWPALATHQPLIRRAPVKRFPYCIAYQLDENAVTVLAVQHAKRRPLYWLSRTASKAG